MFVSVLPKQERQASASVYLRKEYFLLRMWKISLACR